MAPTEARSDSVRELVPSVRVLTRDVILVSTHLRMEGQRLVGGGEIPERDNLSLRVLHRQPDGRWLIVSEMYNDANQESTYEAS
jgi:ketosteroid isomerase-like protein